MKWLGIGAGVVLAGIVAIVALLPRLIDWNSYRPEFAALASGAIGRPVVIEGNIRAELFPTPQLTAGRIRVPDGDGAADVASIRWAEARFKFSDLLRGDVTLTDLALIEPVAELSPGMLEKLSLAGSADAAQPSGNGALGGYERRDATRVQIRNGIFTYSPSPGAPVTANRVSGHIETPTVGRRIAVSLTGELGGRDLSLDMRVTPPSGETSAPVSAVVSDLASGARARVDGEWIQSAQGQRLTGAFSIEGPTPDSVATLFGGVMPPAIGMAGPVRIDGKIEVSGEDQRFEATDLSINMDALSATGVAVMRWRDRPRLDLTLRVGRLDLDALRASVGDVSKDQTPATEKGTGKAASAPAEGTSESGTALALTQAEGQDLMAWIGGLPVDVTLDLSVAGARLRDTVVRRISVRGSVDGGTVTLEELSAQLPGGTDLSIAGFGDMTGPEPLLEGNATLRADDLRRLMNWAGLPVPDVSADRLRRFSLVSGISLRPRRLDIIDAAVELDGVTATAAAAVALRRRLGVGLRLTLDHINLDAYRPVVLQGGAMAGGGSGTTIAGDAATGTAADGLQGGVWTAFDASVDVSVGRAVVLGIPFNDLAGNLVLKDGVLTVNEMTFQDAAGVSGTFGGQVAASGGEDAVVVAFEGQSKDLGRLSALLEGPDAVSGFLRAMGPTMIKASYQSAAEGPAMIVQAHGADGGISFGATPVTGVDGVPTLEILSGSMAGKGLSVSGLTGRMTFPPGQYQLEKLTGTLNGGTLTLSGSLQRRDDGLHQLLITGALDGVSVDRALADLDGSIGVSGDISIRGQGEATGSDWRAMTAVNEGWFDIDGALALRVGPARSGIVRVRQVTEVRDALRAHFAAPTPLRGTIRLENGVLRTEDLSLGGDGSGELRLTGRLGLNDLDLSAALVLSGVADGGHAGARLTVEGPASAPNLRLEGAGPSQ